ncbi:hypothetical protein [Streptomyces asiaticus]
MPHRLATATAALLLLCGPAAAGRGGGADPGKQITDIDNLPAKDVKGLVFSPIDSATIAPPG